MPDFPASLVEFQRQFPHDDACAAWLVAARWPSGCDRRHDHAGSKPPLLVWFWAVYLRATNSNRISALQLQKQLGLGSYKSAWLLCAKLRRAMVAPGRAPLAGLIEVDETEIPLRTKSDLVCGGGGRSPEGKMLVAGAVEVENDAPGRLRLTAIKDFSAASLHGFVAGNVAQGATIKTDGWPSYARAPDVRREAPWPPVSFCPGSTAPSPKSRPGRGGGQLARQDEVASSASTAIRLFTANQGSDLSRHCSAGAVAAQLDLVLLCHKLARWQQGQRSKRRAMLRASLIRIVAIDALMWRSARIGGSAGSITRG